MNPLLLLLLGGGAIWAITKKPAQQTQTRSSAPPVPIPASALPPPEDMPPEAPAPSVQVNPPAAPPIPMNLPNPLSVPQNLPNWANLPSQPPANPTQPPAYTPPDLNPSQPNTNAQDPGQAAAPAPSIPDLIAQLPGGLQAAAQSAQTVLTNLATAAQQQASTQTPLQAQDVATEQDSNGSVALAKALIDREATPHWKGALKPQIKSWQAIVGLKPDGEFGEASAIRMSQDVGILPLVRYWPFGSVESQEVPSYQSQLNQIASGFDSSNPTHAIALRASAGFENGAGYDKNPPPIDSSLRQQQSAALSQAVASQAVSSATQPVAPATSP
jgi:hypothetical protein